MSSKKNKHFDYYTKHKISPVTYNSSLLELLEQRRSLYRGIGILSSTIQAKNVLEIAAGSGQNSMFISINNPKRLVLIEPNRTALNDIFNNYGKLELAHTKPEIFDCRLEDYKSEERFDIVICENWLGSNVYERSLRKKCLAMVGAHGLFVSTVISPIGILPNILRRYLSLKLLENVYDFDDKVCVLVDAFGSHLDTLLSMNRSNRDWVIDNMLHPAYLSIVTTLPELLLDSRIDFSIFKIWPSFNQDWRWFKDLFGKQKKFNEVALAEYAKWSHGFIDYRYVVEQADGKRNMILEKTCLELIQTLLAHENYVAKGIKSNPSLLEGVLMRIKGIVHQIYPKEIVDALNEAIDLCLVNEISTTRVSQMNKFKFLFGRETIYVSLERM